MKTVVSTSQVAHLFANQSQAYARNPQGNFYFHGPILFSYRDSFPLRVLTPWRMPNGKRVVIGRADIPSNTTRRHEANAWSAFRGHDVHVIDIAESGWQERNEKENYFRDIGRREADALARGDADALRAVVAYLVKCANVDASSALKRTYADRTAYDYQSAAGYLETARNLASANAKGNAARSLAALIRRNAPALPHLVGDADTAADERARIAHEFARARRLELRDAKRAADLVNLVKSAREHEKDARAARFPGAAVAHLEGAAMEWRKAETLARKFKRPAAERAKYRANANACDKRANKSRPAAALESARALAENMARYSRTVAGLKARGRRMNNARARFRDTGRIYRPHSIAAARDSMPDAWNVEARTRAANIAAASATLADILASDAPRERAEAATRAGFQYHENSSTCVTLRAMADAGNANARALVRDLVAATRQAEADARAFFMLARKRDVVLTLRQWVRGNGERLAAGADTVNVANARDLAHAAGAMLARVADVRAEFATDAEAAPILAALVPFTVAHLETLKTRADTFAQVADNLEKLRGRYSSMSAEAIARAINGAECSRLENLAYRAQTDIVNAAASLARATTEAESAARAIAGELSRPELEGFAELRAAWEDAARYFDAQSVALANLAPELERVRADIIADVSHAAADPVLHWRKTGEKGPGWLAATANDTCALFRTDARGDIVSSLGAHVSAHAGRRLWAMIRACVASGTSRTWAPYTGPHVGAFSLESINADGSAKVGCHRISAHEAREFARYMSWPPFGATTEADALADGEA